MLLIKNPRIFHNISIRFINEKALIIPPFSINSRSSREDFFLPATIRLQSHFMTE